MLPERQTVVPAGPSPVPLTPAPAVPPSTADAVDRILSHTESAVASIVRRTEHQVREIAADVDARAAREAAERSARLAELRRELIDRASALAIHYEEILDQLDAVEAALSALAGERRMRPEQAQPGPAGARVTAIETRVSEQPRRRWWRLWQREAA
jgi:hypothetical protein